MLILTASSVMSQNNGYYLDLVDQYAREFDGNNVVLGNKNYYYYNGKQQLVYEFQKDGSVASGFKNTYYTNYEYNEDNSIKARNYERWYIVNGELSLGEWRKQTRDEYTYLDNGKLSLIKTIKYNFNQNNGMYTEFVSLKSEYFYNEDLTIKEIKTMQTYSEAIPLKDVELLKYLDYANGKVGKIEKWTPKYGKPEILELSYKTDFEYDESGNITKRSEAKGNGDKVADYVFSYDGDGKMLTEIKIEKPWDSNEMQETHKTVYTYDENGNLVKKETFNKNGSTSSNWNEAPIQYDIRYLSKQGHQLMYEPTNLQITPNGTNFSLQWTAPQDGAKLGYNVYMNGVKINTTLVTATNYDYTSIYNENAFCFVTQVYNAEGNESNISNLVYKTRSECGNGATNVTANVTKSIDTYSKDEKAFVKVNWTASATTTGLLGYDIYANGDKKNNLKVNGTTYSFDILIPGDYEIEVQAIYSNNCIPVSGSCDVSIDLKRHNAPSNVTITQIPGLLAYKLEWQHSTDFPDTFKGFAITRSSKVLVPATAPIMSTSYVDIDVEPNTYYQYGISAVFSDLTNNPATQFGITTVDATPVGIVNVVPNNLSYGSVEGGGDIVAVGSTVELIATPASGYEFKNWAIGDEILSSNANYEYTVRKGQQTVIAIFVKEKTNYCLDEKLVYAHPSFGNPAVELIGRMLYFYDAKLDLNYKLYQFKNGSVYEPAQLNAYTYNNMNEIESELKSDYQEATGVWMNKTKSHYTYLVDGKVDAILIDGYNGNGDVYMSERNDYEYNITTGLLEKISFSNSYSGEDFKLNLEERYTEYSDSRELLKLEYWAPEYSSGVMSKTAETTYEYDEIGKLVKKRIFQMSYDNQELIEKTVVTYTYNDNGLLSAELTELRVMNNDPLSEYSKIEYNYDVDNNLVKSEAFSKEGANWVLSAKDEYNGSSDRHKDVYVPLNLTISEDGMNSNLSWTAPEDYKGIGYNVYKDAIRLNEAAITGTNYTYNSSIYSDGFFFVSQVLEGEKESDISNVVTRARPSCENTATITSVDVKIEVDQNNNNNEIANVKITWTVPTTDLTINGYDIYVNGLKKTNFPISADDRTYELNIRNSGEYTFNVAIIYGNGCNPMFSNAEVRQINLKVHAAPVVSAVQIQDQLAVNISWTHNTDFENLVEGYYVMRDGVAISDKNNLIEGNSFIDIFPKVGNQYSYSVAAVFSDLSHPVIGYSPTYPIIVEGTSMGIVNVSVSNDTIASVNGGGIYAVNETAELVVTEITDAKIEVKWFVDGVEVYDGFTYNYRIKGNKIVNIVAEVRPLSGVKNVDELISLVYPNPITDGLVFVKGYFKQIQILDVAGRVVRDAFVEGGNVSIDVNGLKGGTYMLKAIDINNNIQVVKVIIK